MKRKIIILGAILCTTSLTAAAQSACDPVEPPKGLAGVFYAMGQAGTAHAGLATDQQIQQQRCQQEIQLKQLELQQQQLELQRQAMGIEQKAAATEPITPPVKTPAQICRDRGFNWYGYCADNKTTGGQK